MVRGKVQGLPVPEFGRGGFDQQAGSAYLGSQPKAKVVIF